MYSNVNGSQLKKKERKLSVIFRHTSANQHVAGIEALAVDPVTSTLYTASRDSIVKRWNVSQGQPQCQSSFEGHIDWVNDVLLYEDKLVTCSSDRTVKLWQTGEEGRCLHTTQNHSDYVTCLAASPAAGKLVSAGLRSEVILYDMHTMSAALLMPYPSSSSNSSTASSTTSSSPEPGGAAGDSPGGLAGGPGQAQQAQMRSTYALAMNAAGTLVAVGTTEPYIRLLDPRTGQKVMKLKGHSDNIRALLVNDEGTLLLSGSSDHTIRLWDLGQQRCIQTLAVHTDSVWCLAASPDLSLVYSGGRDKAVYVTNMLKRQAWLLAREQQPVRDIALADGGSKIWVATTSSNVNGYNLPRDQICPVAYQQHQQRQHQQEQQQQPDQLQQDGQQQDPQQQQQQQQQPPPLDQQVPDRFQQDTAAAAGGGGLPGGRSLAASASGRHIFGVSASVRLRHSQDPGAGGDMPLVSAAATVQGSPGLVALRVLTDKRHILTKDSEGNVQLWDVLSGAPIQQLGQVDIAEVEKRLFRPLYVESWFSADIKLGALAINLEPPKCFAAEAYALDLGAVTVADDQKVNLGACLLRSALCQWAHAFSKLYLSGAPIPGLDDPGAEQLPRFRSDLTPAVVSTNAAGLSWRVNANAFTGKEREGDDIPTWVTDAVLRGVLPYVKELKSAFVLQPAEGSGLPSLLQSRLNAPRILQVMKVANYCVTKLSELNVNLNTHEVGMTPDTQMPQATGQQYLELTCNGVAVPYCMSIATVKKFIWKRSDDVLFHYKILDPARLAPFPAFTIPDS